LRRTGRILINRGGRKRPALAEAFLVLCLGVLSACASANVDRGGDAVPAATQQHLTNLMNESAVAWNRGDLDAFLSTYKDDNQTAFMAPQITYGLRDIKARYERSYFKDGKPKAQLSFGDLKFRRLGPAHILMTGRWYLQEPEGKKTEGYYTLIWEDTEAGWKMIHDHSS
jgi:ketosteroid isomerase-like protein